MKNFNTALSTTTMHRTLHPSMDPQLFKLTCPSETPSKVSDQQRTSQHYLAAPRCRKCWQQSGRVVRLQDDSRNSHLPRSLSHERASQTPWRDCWPNWKICCFPLRKELYTSHVLPPCPSKSLHWSGQVWKISSEFSIMVLNRILVKIVGTTCTKNTKIRIKRGKR